MTHHRLVHLRVRNHLVAVILDGHGHSAPLPSVRVLAGELQANPLTVAKAYQSLLDDGIVYAKRGVGFFVSDGGTGRLSSAEKARFLSHEWPRIRGDMERLHLDVQQLVANAIR